jgi:hypothetical protein
MKGYWGYEGMKGLRNVGLIVLVLAGALPTANAQVIQMQKRTISPTGRTAPSPSPAPQAESQKEPTRLTYLERLAKSPMRDRYTSGLKLNPSAWAVGAYPISYEYRAGKHVSWELGAVPVYRNFWRESIWPAHSGLSILQGEYAWGLGAFAQGKYFFSKPAFQNGWYLGGHGQYRPYSATVSFLETNSGGGTVLQTIRPFRRYYDAGLLVGYHVRAAERWLVDFSFGAGVRRLQLAEAGEFINANSETVAELAPTAWSAMPYVQTSVRIGWLLPKKR